MQLAALVQAADAARDSGASAEAAAGYGAAVAIAPGRVDLVVQHGNMLKDCGRLADAEAAYRAALLARPADADTYVQLGHALKLQGRRTAALAAYRTAAELDPGSPQALAELVSAGQPEQLGAAFRTQLRQGGAEAVISMSRTLLAMQADLKSMIDRLPDAQTAAAFPIGLYSSYRDVFRVPPPPPPRLAPEILVVLLADQEPAATLHAQLAAFQAQTWPHRTLAAVGRDEARRAIVERAAAATAGVRWVAAEPCQTAMVAERQCARAASADWPSADWPSADWVLLLGHGAILDAQALAWIASAAETGPAAAFVWDGEQGEIRPGHIVRSGPVLRQAVDYDALLEANLYGESLAVRSTAYAAFAASPMMPSVSAERSALLLHVCRSAGVGHVPFPLTWSLGCAAAPVDAPVDALADGAHRSAVAAHLDAQGAAASIAGPGVLPGSLDIAWRSVAEPLQVIIPTRDNADDVAALVASLRATASWQEGMSIAVIDNGGRNPAMRDRLQALAAEGGIELHTVDAPFNWSQLNNRAARAAAAPIIVFANDDMRMLTPGWDARLRGLLQRPEVGAVGVRLIYDDDMVQHAGVLFGWKGSTIHDGLYEPMTSPGPGGRLQVTRAVSAVTGAFLATRRETFNAFGGFDEAGLPVSYSDVDFCLKLRAGGLRVLWTPRITLVHHESKTRGQDHLDLYRQARNGAERAILEARWAGWLDSDPGVNPAWHDGTLPFRLLAGPSSARVRQHVAQCAAANPWLVGQPR